MCYHVSQQVYFISVVVEGELLLSNMLCAMRGVVPLRWCMEVCLLSSLVLCLVIHTKGVGW
jgi:hypothetical protein